MSDEQTNEKQPQQAGEAGGAAKLEGGTYEIIRARLTGHGRELRQRVSDLNEARKQCFGALESRLIGTERVTTENNCVPRDMVAVGDRFIFGYNVFIGLRAETVIEDVFAIYEWRDGGLQLGSLDMLRDQQFQTDFRNLYKYYRGTTFAKFAVIGNHLYMVFRVGKTPEDVKTFKWLLREDSIQYIDNRSDHEFRFPSQHEFDWRRVTHDMHRSGTHPHVSIEDRVFVETIGGDLTVKIEDNTTTGEGIFSEPVEDPDQTLDDAEMYYAIVGNVIVIKVRPYQEEKFRYIVYNEKIQEAVGVPALADACILLPDGHGLIFPRGYYLQTGELKQFDTQLDGMLFERRIAAPNGEDYLYVFFNRPSGTYVLLSYNLISQQVNTPIICNGFSVFDDGRLIYFRADSEAQKHHSVQIWQTPYCGPDFHIETDEEAYLYRIGNKDIVRCMAECHEIISLLERDDTFADLYVDIARKAQDVRDSYFWADHEEAFNLAEPLEAIRSAAASAVDEFEKVVRTKKNTATQIRQVSTKVRDLINSIDYYHLNEIQDYVSLLADMRAVRGEVISLRDLRYADASAIDALEKEVADHTDKLSQGCVEFLLKPEALAPYHKRVEQQRGSIDKVAKVADAKELSEEVAQTSRELEMLIEIVSNLKIADTTQTTAIIDNISLVMAELNQVRAALRKRRDELASAEGRAEFTAQLKLIDQAALSYLDVCDTPERCDEYATKIMVQLETLESRFAEFDEFIGTLTEKRESLYGAFESRKVQLVEKRQQRAAALMSAAERVLKGIRNRVAGLESINEINGYFASDLMIERVRETIEALKGLGDVVKAEDISSQLKTLQQDAVRQLKDRQALYEDGENIIRFGEHRFAVNRQPLELTIVQRDGGMFFHMSGTAFMEPIRDEELLHTRRVWGMDTSSESEDVYRAEYLAFLFLESVELGTAGALAELAEAEPEDVLRQVQEFMAPRYDEGYVKGVHDADAAAIVGALARLRPSIGLLRYPPRARALATVFWETCADADRKRMLAARSAGVGAMDGLFEIGRLRDPYIGELRAALEEFDERTGLFSGEALDLAAEYLFFELSAGHSEFVLSGTATGIRDGFLKRLRSSKYKDRFEKALAGFDGDPLSRFRVARDWVSAYVEESEDASGTYIDEVAALFMDGDGSERPVLDVEEVAELPDMAGSHARIGDGCLRFRYCDFVHRLRHHQRHVVPLFESCRRRKKELIAEFSDELRLDEFKPQVLTTFVRNRLLDKVYLPLVGDNLAKQIGTAGETKRTDRQGMLLLISPPGYGKTTLMAYIANRLGLTFVKVNGPALGHEVTALDPACAGNMAARQELEKLNLAFEMGDNVMVYLDDIQHCNPELLQKFIPLCDAQRRVEGVYQGKARTYDLRGRRVCVIMAGNPYTESGDKFKVPDMLANRADTYNIGDIVGDNYDEFISSYVENGLTSNPILSKLAGRSRDDVYCVMKIAETGSREGVEFEGSYGLDELNEYVSTMKKLFVVREVVLKVNQQYIRSAGQADDYRTEPPFLLQGSYRNMNRITARVLPVMNDEELWTLIMSAYEQDAQTLTSGAEANLLKFKELMERLSVDEAERWDDIKRTFNRNKLLGDESQDRIGKLMAQLNTFSAGLDEIRVAIRDGANALSQRGRHGETDPLPARLDQFGKAFESIGSVLSDGVAALKEKASASDEGSRASAEAMRSAMDGVIDKLDQVITAVREADHEHTVDLIKTEALQAAEDANSMLGLLEGQFKTMRDWLEPLVRDPSRRSIHARQVVNRFERMASGYNSLAGILRERFHVEKREDETEEDAMGEAEDAGEDDQTEEN